MTEPNSIQPDGERKLCGVCKEAQADFVARSTATPVSEAGVKAFAVVGGAFITEHWLCLPCSKSMGMDFRDLYPESELFDPEKVRSRQ